VAAAIADWLRAAPEHTGDPGRVHADGRTVRAVIEAARDEVAALFGVRPRQVIFTSGGTEAVNAATWSATRARPGAPVVCAEVEHSAARDASARAGAVAVAPCDRLGRVHAEAVADVLGALEDRGTPAALVHCQLANHEVGTVQPVDACAAAGQMPLAVDELGADYVSVSAHKLGGPPGAGALIVRRNLRVEPFVVGGEQERARRGGMENVPGIVGFGAAAGALAGPGRLEGEAAAARRRRDALEAAATAVAGVEVLGDPDGRLPHIACLGVGGVEAEPVLLGLDQAGISAHSGSACSSESLAPSPVLAAMGADAERSLRLSVGWSSTDADVEAFAAAFPGVVSALRALRG